MARNSEGGASPVLEGKNYSVGKPSKGFTRVETTSKADRVAQAAVDLVFDKIEKQKRSSNG